MFKLIRIMLFVFCVLAMTQATLHAAALEGDPSLIKDWFPTNPCVTFYYVDNRIDGVEVSFKVEDTKLFREWQLRRSDGTTTRVPFIMEVTLVLSDGFVVRDLAHANGNSLALNTRGQDWDFGISDECTSHQDIAYIDTHLSDVGEDHFGIGILYPELLKEGHTYKFWIKLEPMNGIMYLPYPTVQLRFRLNLDVGKAYALSYWPKDNFDLGPGWEGGYFIFPEMDNPQHIAEVSSFAILNFKSQDVSFADYDWSRYVQTVYWNGKDGMPPPFPIVGARCLCN